MNLVQTISIVSASLVIIYTCIRILDPVLDLITSIRIFVAEHRMMWQQHSKLYPEDANLVRLVVGAQGEKV